MSEMLRKRLDRLIGTWRESAAWEAEQGNHHRASEVDQCADELEAALRESPAATPPMTGLIADLFQALKTARRVLEVACGTKAPYIREAFKLIDPAITKAEAVLRELPAAAPLFTWTEFDVIKTAIRNSREIGTAQYFHLVKKLQTVSEHTARAAAPEGK
jgi:hypothetical protein